MEGHSQSAHTGTEVGGAEEDIRAVGLHGAGAGFGSMQVALCVCGCYIHRAISFGLGTPRLKRFAKKKFLKTSKNQN